MSDASEELDTASQSSVLVAGVSDDTAALSSVTSVPTASMSTVCVLAGERLGRGMVSCRAPRANGSSKSIRSTLHMKLILSKKLSISTEAQGAVRSTVCTRSEAMRRRRIDRSSGEGSFLCLLLNSCTK
ncbi:hypothetical protein BDY19DRAFT_153464 [Irpex rosettiformis]|uniref:Uncharacterized protein n=1 Tax=Irpex rosettiformis TaxID=378272 RepID=A0ACB8U3J9_9APHY|nr:hypothetical protein BDY19DRAFT_153464 [Irpex rosettiformis]